MQYKDQAIAWTNADLPSVMLSNIDLRIISKKINRPSVTGISLKIPI